MKSFLHLLCLLLTSSILLPMEAYAAKYKRTDLRELPAFIEANKRKRDVIFNSPKYDKNAKVFYIYHVSRSYSSKYFEKDTDFLAEAYKKIFRKGAELIIHVEYSDEDAERTERYKKMKYYDATDIPKLARQSSLKCPFLNSHKMAVRQILFQTKRNKSAISYSNSELRAANPDGEPIAFFSQVGDSIVMTDGDRNNRKILIQGGFSSATWQADVILASYKQLIALVEKEEQARQPQKEEAKDEQSKHRSKSKAKGKKHDDDDDDEEEESIKLPRWKKVNING